MVKMMLMKNLLPNDGILHYIPDFYKAAQATASFNTLLKNIQWQQDRIRMYGKEHNLPRLQAWYGDEGTDYRYSGIDLTPIPWIPELLRMKKKIEKFCDEDFNSLLINLYRTGSDYVAWHADKEKELGPKPYIASLSFGGVRKFQLKHKKDPDQEIVSLDLEAGSLVIMAGEIQKYWNHRIVPTKKACDPRINLTFRKVII